MHERLHRVRQVAQRCCHLFLFFPPAASLYLFSYFLKLQTCSLNQYRAADSFTFLHYQSFVGFMPHSVLKKRIFHQGFMNIWNMSPAISKKMGVKGSETRVKGGNIYMVVDICLPPHPPQLLLPHAGLHLDPLTDLCWHLVQWDKLGVS